MSAMPSPHAAPPARLTPIEARYAPPLCFALLATACGLASFAFACATPFAAFAVIAAAALPLRPALAVVAAAWAVNQAIGFGVLGYPHDANTILWGVAIGAAALIGTTAAALMLRSLARLSNPVALGLAFIAAYAAYELVLYAATLVLGGAGSFTAAIVARLGILSLLWLIGLVAACEVFRLVAAARQRAMAS